MDTKSALRTRMAALRDALPAGERAAMSEAVARRLTGWKAFARAQTIFAFISTRSEVDTAPIIAAALAQGKVVAAPRTLLRERRLEFHRLAGLTGDLVPGPFGLREPRADAPAVEVARADLILVPGLAFDQRGYRVGYGGGFYDRLLSHPACRAQAAGIAFRQQVIAAVPHGPADRPVDWVVSDERLIDCRRARGPQPR